MASPRLKVGGFDFSPFLRTQPDESPAADPSGSAYFRPQFSGAPALGEGSSWVADAVDNRTMVFPVYFTASTRAEIQQLIREADLALVKGAQVEFAVDPEVDPSSFFDLERGTVAEDFNFYHLINGILGATLTLTVRPYANSGTHRLIASIPAATSAVVEFAASGILGDAYGLANIEVRVGSQVASNGRVIAWAVHPHPSHNPYRAATSGLAQEGATVLGASGAIGSQYTAIPISPTGASGVAYKVFLDPPDAHIGRHRVIAIGRSGLSVPIPLWAEDRFGAALGATAIASQTDVNKWQIIDLGEVNVPARASGQDTVPTQYVNIYGGGASGASVVASGGLSLNGILFLPLDYSAGIMRTQGAAAPANTLGDAFSRFPNTLQETVRLENSPNGDYGGQWARISGYFGNSPNWSPPAFISPIEVGHEEGQFVKFMSGPGATGFYSIGSGVALADTQFAALVQMAGQRPSAGCASQSFVAVYPKMQASGPYVKAKLCFGPSPYLALISGASPGAENLRASAGMPSMLASGIFLGEAHTLTIRVLSGRTDVWLATGPLSPSPVLSASHGDFGLTGYPALQMQNGPLGASGSASSAFVKTKRVLIYGFGASAADIGPRQFFRFESHPEGRTYQGSASAFVADRLANYRGQFPKLPPIGSGAVATGPARVVVLQGEIDNLQGLDGPDIALTVLERYRFLR